MKTSHRPRGGKGSQKTLIRSALICAAALAVAVGALLYGGGLLQKKGAGEAVGDLATRFQDEFEVSYDGKKYRENPLLKSYLVMGIDKRDNALEEDGIPNFRNGGQCDFLMLWVVDTEHGTTRRIQIDRDAMAEITVLGILGNDLGTSRMQICLAHGFGDGGAQSCQFAVEAVQRLLCGIEIDGYFAIDLDGIEALNDVLGGVTVTLEDDFSMLDPAMTQGTTLTLQGKQAEYFVRQRMVIGDGTNAARMLRQEKYLSAAMDLAAGRIMENPNFIGTLFDALEPYTTTNLSRGKLVNEANKSAKFETKGTLALPGEHATGEDGFIEFHVDENALTSLVLDVFYDPVD